MVISRPLARGPLSVRPMPLPLKPEYQPTLGQLLTPAWRRASAAVRVLVALAGAALLVAVVALVLTLLPASVSYGPPVPFSFKYKSLWRVPAPPGAWVRVERRSDGRLLDSFQVRGLTLPPYSGGLSGELPVYASGYIQTLAARYRDFRLVGEGKTRVNSVPAYMVFFETQLEGQEMYGRNVLLLAGAAGVRRGVIIEMLSRGGEEAETSSPLFVGTTGVLQQPLRTFTLG